ncbi:hypothetical protein CR513_07841, partial [Mucuna pruriens]
MSITRRSTQSSLKHLHQVKFLIVAIDSSLRGTEKREEDEEIDDEAKSSPTLPSIKKGMQEVTKGEEVSITWSRDIDTRIKGVAFKCHNPNSAPSIRGGGVGEFPANGYVPGLTD